MRPSPLQLRHFVYKNLSVAPHSAEEEATNAVTFDFEGVNIRAKVGTALKKGQEEDPRDFLVELEIVIDNKIGKATPYDIGVGVLGVFHVLPTLPKERREDLVTVNGASLLYGMIREVVLSLTSRFSAGALTLPGMNFEDDAPSVRRSRSAEQAIAGDKPKKDVRNSRKTSKKLVRRSTKGRK